MESMTDYMGTYSKPSVPYTRKTTDDHRGAGKGNDIRTRSHTIAITDCKVYKSEADYAAGKVSHTIESRRNVSSARKVAKRTNMVAAVLPEASNIKFKDAAQLFGN